MYSVLLRLLLLLFLPGPLLSYCNSNPSPDREAESNTDARLQDGYEFPYHLNGPDKKISLPSELEEISGLAYFGEGKLACIQDEKAHIYLLDIRNDLKKEEYDFGKDGDFEDIAISGKSIYVLRNDGKLYKIKDLDKKDLNVKKYKTPLSENNDTEGLVYDALTHSLLIACKGSPSLSKKNPYQGYRAIYRFNLDTKELDEKPQYLINLADLDTYSDRGAVNRLSRTIARRLKLTESKTSFKPSGISIHPEYGEIYLISSVGKLLIVMDRRGGILDVHELDPSVFRQPEGICFSPRGDLFISSEGKGGKGYILKFKPRMNE